MFGNSLLFPVFAVCVAQAAQYENINTRMQLKPKSAGFALAFTLMLGGAFVAQNSPAQAPGRGAYDETAVFS